MPHRLSCLALIVGLLAATAALAQAPAAEMPGIAISGNGVTTAQITRESLASLPRTEQRVAIQTSKGTLQATVEGVLLWDVLKSAVRLDPSAHHPELQRTVLVTAKDGYAVVFAMGEISPELGNKAIVIAQSMDGRPLPPRDGLRLIVPGDVRGARSVRDVVSMEIR